MPTVISSREQTFKCLENLPKFSPMMSQLLAHLTKRDCEVSSIVSIVEMDPLLSAQVLRLANSAVFGRKRRVQTVKHAVSLLGVGPMRRFAMGTSLANLFSRFKAAPEFSLKRFSLHSIATGTMAELMSEALPVAGAESAFVAGLLHDIGKLIIAQNLSRQYTEILGLHALTNRPMLECEREIIGTDHAELSALAIARWDLAEPLWIAARYHHDPESAREIDGSGSRKLGLSLIINRADTYVNFQAISVQRLPWNAAEPPSLAFEGFPYSEARVLKRFADEWKNLGDIFG